jgi:hypothetical protein
MRSHGVVRALMDHLVAAMLSALLAGPSVAPRAPSVVDQSDASATQGPAMEAPPGPTASAALSMAPAAAVAPLSATARFVVTLDTLAGGRTADGTSRPAVLVKSAPTILRI